MLRRSTLWLLLPVVIAAACQAPTEVSLPAKAQLIEAPPAYALWWQVTESCSGLTGDLSKVRFYVVPGVNTIADGSDQSLGMWYSSGNRIVLAGGHELDPRVVRHEMLHALIGPTNGEGHPNEYFVQRCGGVVDCQNVCLTDGPPPPAPDMLATVLDPKQIQLELQLQPAAPSPTLYGGWLAVTVMATNPLDQPVWVSVPRAAPGRADGETFAYALQGAVAGSDYTLDEAVYFTAHQTRRYTFDVPVGTGDLAARGSYSLSGLFATAQTPATSVVVGP